jgi:hypothetical protein
MCACLRQFVGEEGVDAGGLAREWCAACNTTVQVARQQQGLQHNTQLAAQKHGLQLNSAACNTTKLLASQKRSLQHKNRAATQQRSLHHSNRACNTTAQLATQQHGLQHNSAACNTKVQLQHHSRACNTAARSMQCTARGMLHDGSSQRATRDVNVYSVSTVLAARAGERQMNK